MINSYTSTSQTILTNALINFNINAVKTGCTVTHAEGTPTFSLNRPGLYYVAFNADALPTAAGDLVAQLRSNNELVPGAIATTTTGTTTSTENLFFSRVIQVKPSCCSIDNSVKLTVINSGVGATYSNANIVITKLC